MPIRSIAIDDEPYAIGIIKDYCSRIPFIELVATFNSGIEAINYLKNNKVDLVFLDIQMRDITGIQILEIVKPMPAVILTTAFNHYAVESYDYQVVDYLLKPFSFDRFLKAVTRCIDNNSASQPQPASETSAPANDRFIFIKSGYAIHRIDFDDICYIEGQKDYLLVRTHHEKILTLQSFKQFEDILPKNEFIRVHKSYVVAIKKIAKIERARIKVLDTEIPIGESYKEYFFQSLKGKMY